MTRPGNARTVLVVDDHESMRLLVGRMLSQELGVRIVLAGTCEQALHLAEETVYDAIVLDLLMPGIGGFEVLRRLRADSANLATPVAVLSVMADEESILRCKVLRANSFLAKPVERKRLAAAIEALLPSRVEPIPARSWRRAEEHC